MVDEGQLEKQQRAKKGFIRAFGMFWSRDEVDWWGEHGALELLGRVNKNRGAVQVVNFWDQRGIYVLYNDHGPYYVGKTVRPSSWRTAASTPEGHEPAQRELESLFLVWLATSAEGQGQGGSAADRGGSCRSAD